MSRFDKLFIGIWIATGILTIAVIIRLAYERKLCREIEKKYPKLDQAFKDYLDGKDENENIEYILKNIENVKEKRLRKILEMGYEALLEKWRYERKENK